MPEIKFSDSTLVVLASVSRKCDAINLLKAQENNMKLYLTYVCITTVCVKSGIK